MAKITLHEETQVETPSQSIVKAANRVVMAKDGRGRNIGVRMIGALDRMRMFEVVGAENARNEPYMIYAAAAFHVASIDGESVMRPGTKNQLEALIQRLDEDGVAAVLGTLQEQFAPPEADSSADALKN